MNKKQQQLQAAVAAMQGHCSNPHEEIRTASSRQIAEWSVDLADALIAELDRTKPEPETPQPDADGWIPYAPGGPLPCPDNARIFIKTQGGYESEEWSYAFTIDWENNENDPNENIVAWKPA